MKNLLPAAAAAACIVASLPAAAIELGNGLDLSFNAGLTSNYMWRGMTQSENHIAVQGGADITHESGFYVGTWASSTQFYYAHDANAEVDFYGGYKFNLGDVGMDLKYIEYYYPGATELNFSEYHVGSTWNNFALSMDYSEDTPIMDATTGDIDGNVAMHYSLGYTFSLPYELSLTPTVGNYHYKDTWVGNEDDYDYYSLALTKTMWDLNWALTWSDTNVSGDDCEAFAGDQDYCDSTLALGVTKAF